MRDIQPCLRKAEIQDADPRVAAPSDRSGQGTVPLVSGHSHNNARGQQHGASHRRLPRNSTAPWPVRSSSG